VKNKKYTCYLVIDAETLYCQGAFDLSDEGYEKAKKHLRKLDKKQKKYKIIKK